MCGMASVSGARKCRHDGAKSPRLSNATIGGVNDAVLVTGGAGFIGSHLVERLLADGARGRVLDNFSTGTRANLPSIAKFRGRLEVIRGDIRSEAAVVRAARGARVIYHQAAMRSVPRSVKDPLGANANNVTGTLNVLEAARRCRVRRGVFASSSSVFSARAGSPAVLPRFTLRAPRGRPHGAHGAGTQSRDYPYIDNVVGATVLAARAPD